MNAATTRPIVTASANGNRPSSVCSRIAARTVSGLGSRRGEAKCAAICQSAIIANNEPSRAANSGPFRGIVEGGKVERFGGADELRAADFGDRLEQG